MNDPGIQMTCTCGACPEQWEGSVDGNPAYFRLRHSHWTFTIVKPGASPYGDATPEEILYKESGDHNIGQDAGAMEDAQSLIIALVAVFRRGRDRREESDGFLKFLEENCPGDDAHDGGSRPEKPLLARCALCASIYEEHLKDMKYRNQGIRTMAKTLVHYIHAIKRHQLDLESCPSEPCAETMKFLAKPCSACGAEHTGSCLPGCIS